MDLDPGLLAKCKVPEKFQHGFVAKKSISASVSLRIVIVKLSRAVKIEQIDMKIYFVL